VHFRLSGPLASLPECTISPTQSAVPPWQQLGRQTNPTRAHRLHPSVGPCGKTFFTETLIMRMTAEITTWIPECRWGFAIAKDGQKVFVHEVSFRNRWHIPKVRVGTKIEFELSAPRTDEQRFLDLLNAGKLRDEELVKRCHRKPRRKLISNEKPKAINVVVVE
jgi:hypothetical protein